MVAVGTLLSLQAIPREGHPCKLMSDPESWLITQLRMPWVLLDPFVFFPEVQISEVEKKKKKKTSDWAQLKGKDAYDDLVD